MSALEKYRSPVDRQLEAYQESWQRDHVEAIACRDWEDAIAVGISVFRMLRERERAWRDQVFRGDVVYAEQEDADQRGRFGYWLNTTRECLADVLPNLHKQFGKVEGELELRQCADEAAKILREWKPPRLSMTVALSDMTLTQEAANELDRILEHAQQNPPPRVERTMEIKDASFWQRTPKKSNPA